MALSQHYGLGSRFLAWTRSSKAAAYFGATDFVAQPSNVTEFAIWAFSTAFDATRKGLTGVSSAFPDRVPVVVTAPYSSNANLHAQQGVHIARPITGVKWSAPAERDDLLEHLKNVEDLSQRLGGSALLKFVVPISEAPTVLWYLAKEGVTAARLFPGYFGAAQSALKSALCRKPKQ